jgi:hypothetical protein
MSAINAIGKRLLDGAALPPRVRLEARRDRLEAPRLALRQRPNTGMVEDEEPEFRALKDRDAILPSA